MNNNSFFNPNLVGNNGPGTPLYTPNGPVPNQETAPYQANGSAAPMLSDDPYIENVLKRTARLKASVYMTFPDSTEWRDRVFTGILEASGRDHIVLSEPTTGNWYILPLIYMDYISFDENLGNYLRKS